MSAVQEASLPRVQPAMEPSASSGDEASAGSSTRPASSRTWAWVVGAIVPALILIGWETVARVHLISPQLFPPPSVVAGTIGKLAASGELLQHIGATLYRMALGFVFGVAAGTLLGAVTGYSAGAKRLLDPAIQGLRSIPSLAWVPLFILWLGIFETSKVTLIAVGVFFPVYLNLAEAILGVDRKLVEVARVYRYSGAQMIRHVLLPAALPTYLIGIRSGLGMGWMFVVAAELMGASEGLGFLLIDGQQTSNAAIIIASIVLFAVIGKISDGLLALAGARLLRWQDAFKPEA
jgi:sulfonate transport system permease protein